MRVITMAIILTVAARVEAVVDLCNSADRQRITNQTAGAGLVSVASTVPVPPGSLLQVRVGNAGAFVGVQTEVNLRARFFSLEGTPAHIVEYTSNSWTFDRASNEFRVDVPQAITGTRGSLTIESNLPATCTNPNGTTYTAQQLSFGTVSFDYAPPDAPIPPFSAQVALLGNGNTRVTWIIPPNVREFSVDYSPRGQGRWTNVNYLGLPPELPPTQSSLDVPLPNPEQFEFRVGARNFLHSTLSNVVALDQRVGEVTVSHPPPFVSVLCDGTFPVSEIGAYLDGGDGLIGNDVDGDGRDDGFDVPFPAYPVVDLLARDGYVITPGHSYANDGVTRANLIIVARFYGCGSAVWRPQMVAAHVAVWEDGAGLHVVPIMLLAGDLVDAIGDVEGPIHGEILYGNFDVSLDPRELLDRGRAVGSATGAINWKLHGATINFNFEVPVETR